MNEYLLIPIIIMALVASFLFRKYIDNAMLGIILRIVWLLVMVTIFFVFSSRHFNLAQNLTVGFAGGSALVYFLYRLKSIRQNSDQYKSNNRRRNSEI